MFVLFCQFLFGFSLTACQFDRIVSPLIEFFTVSTMTLLNTNLKLKKIEKNEKLKKTGKKKSLFTFCFRTLHGGKQLLKSLLISVVRLVCFENCGCLCLHFCVLPFFL